MPAAPLATQAYAPSSSHHRAAALQPLTCLLAQVVHLLLRGAAAQLGLQGGGVRLLGRQAATQPLAAIGPGGRLCSR